MTFTQLAADNFQRPNENPLSDSGQWTGISAAGAFEIVSHAVQVTTTGVDTVSKFATALPNDQYAEITMDGNPNGYSGPAVRLTGSGATLQGYVLLVSPGTIYLEYISSGARSQVLLMSVTSGVNDVIRLAAQGTTITVTQNGNVIGTYVDTLGIASGAAGVFAYDGVGGTNFFTSWAAGSIYTGSVSSVGLVPSSVTFPTTSTGTVTLDTVAPTGGIVVTLQSSDTTVATVPASVTVLAGQTTATFTVTSLNKTGTSNITGSIGGGSSAFATLSVTASNSGAPPIISAGTDFSTRISAASTMGTNLGTKIIG